MLRGGDRRSLGRAATVVALLRQEPRRIVAIVPLLRDPDPVVAMRAADVLEKFSRGYPASLQPHKRSLLSMLSDATQQEVQWHMAQLVPRLTLTAAERARAFRTLGAYLAGKSSIVRTLALQGMVDLAGTRSRMRNEARQHLLEAVRNGTPAMKARARQLLKAVSKPAR